ncbi:Uncharacterised protein [Acinetobacter baumannii]|nr:Uncharacterised protein [Acinetobacter baumannii]
MVVALQHAEVEDQENDDDGQEGQPEPGSRTEERFGEKCMQSCHWAPSLRIVGWSCDSDMAAIAYRQRGPQSLGKNKPGSGRRQNGEVTKCYSVQ